MTFEKRGQDVVVLLKKKRDGDRYVPSVNTMFNSLSHIFGERCLGIVLTGMGDDGSDGVISIKNNGGRTIAESEETSVIFGMPKEAIATGSVDKVVALDEISNEIVKWIEKF